MSFRQEGLSWHHLTPQDPEPICNDSRYVVDFYESGTVEKAYAYTTELIKSGTYELGLYGYTKFCQNGQVKSGYTHDYAGGRSTVKGSMGKCPMASKSKVELFCNDNLERITLEDACVLPIGKSVLTVNNSVRFHESGSVKIASVIDGKIDAGVNGRQAFAKAGDPYVSFYPEGTVENGNLEKPGMLKVVEGGEKWFEAGVRLKFNRDGYVTGLF